MVVILKNSFHFGNCNEEDMNNKEEWFVGLIYVERKVMKKLDKDSYFLEFTFVWIKVIKIITYHFLQHNINKIIAECSIFDK